MMFVLQVVELLFIVCLVVVVAVEVVQPLWAGRAIFPDFRKRKASKKV